MIAIRPAVNSDWKAIWTMLAPIVRAGEVFALPIDLAREEAEEYWFSKGNWIFVADVDGLILGSYYLRANQRGGGSHVANCGYITAESARNRGIAHAMCTHSLKFAKSQGFRAMQFNFVVSTNEPAVHLWSKHGFQILARLPGSFRHPTAAFVDALVMGREL